MLSELAGALKSSHVRSGKPDSEPARVWADPAGAVCTTRRWAPANQRPAGDIEGAAVPAREITRAPRQPKTINSQRC